MTRVVIHANEAVPWQKIRGNYFAEGFRKIGVTYEFSASRLRVGSALPVLLGTTFWRGIENDGGEYLLVDRCSFGDTEKFVQLVRNGHGRRGDHRVPPHPDGSRWEKHGVPLRPWSKKGRRIILCGQVESYSPDWPELNNWYRKATIATHFRPHPASSTNPTNLPLAYDFKGAGLAITLNSSVGVQAVIEGIPTVTYDAGSMAYDVTTHTIEAEPVTPVRQEWLHWLSFTQWSDDEIREGEPWAQLL